MSTRQKLELSERRVPQLRKIPLEDQALIFLVFHERAPWQFWVVPFLGWWFCATYKSRLNKLWEEVNKLYSFMSSALAPASRFLFYCSSYRDILHDEQWYGSRSQITLSSPGCSLVMVFVQCFTTAMAAVCVGGGDLLELITGPRATSPTVVIYQWKKLIIQKLFDYGVDVSFYLQCTSESWKNKLWGKWRHELAGEGQGKQKKCKIFLLPYPLWTATRRCKSDSRWVFPLHQIQTRGGSSHFRWLNQGKLLWGSLSCLGFS